MRFLDTWFRMLPFLMITAFEMGLCVCVGLGGSVLWWGGMEGRVYIALMAR